MSTQFNCQKHFYFKLFSLFKQLYITIQFSVSTVSMSKTVQFQTIQFSISTQLMVLSDWVSGICDYIYIYIYVCVCVCVCVCGAFNKFPDFLVQACSAFNKFPDFMVQAFKIVVDSWKFRILLLYILWDDRPIFMISGSNEQLQQQLEYTLLKPYCHSWWISKNAIWTWGHFRRTICNKILF